MRALFLIPLLVLSMAPVPGNTGGCAADSDLDQAADFIDFCLTSRSYRCERDEARGMEVDVQACVDAAFESCQGIAFWPESCEPAPRVRETEACIDQLRRSDNLELRLVGEAGVSDVMECRLCD